MIYLCKNCFSDEELKGFILSRNKSGECSYCESKDIEIIEIEELEDFFIELISNFQPKSNGQSLISLIQDNWNLFSRKENGMKILNHVMNNNNLLLSNSEATVTFNDDILDNINYWSELKEQLKWNRRYLTNIEYLTEDLSWDSFFRSQIKLSSAQIFYRARLHHNADEANFSIEQMFSPPAKIATAGRANPHGIPSLYLCDNIETVLYEIRASYLDEVSIASFKLKNTIKDDILISDFTTSPSIYVPGEINHRIKSTLLKKLISEDLSKPMRRYDSDIDYIPTQFICEFIKVFTNVQGIKFKSSLHKFGNNLVIFNQNIMDCFEVKKVRIKALDISSEEL